MEFNDLSFKQIEYNSPAYWEAVTLRSKVLREPLNMRFTEEQLEAERSYVHMAAFLQDKLVSCLYLMQDGEKARLRQFVVDPELHHKGIGRSLLHYMESFCRKQGINYIFMHARESAVPFYEKLGYKKYGEKFLELGLPHWKLQKWL